MLLWRGRKIIAAFLMIIEFWMRVLGIFISTLGTALIESRLRMKYDSKVEKSYGLEELESDPITGHSVKLNAVAKNLIKLEID